MNENYDEEFEMEDEEVNENQDSGFFKNLLSFGGEEEAEEMLEEREITNVRRLGDVSFEEKYDVKRKDAMKNVFGKMFKMKPWRKYLQNFQMKPDGLLGNFRGKEGMLVSEREYENLKDLQKSDPNAYIGFEEIDTTVGEYLEQGGYTAEVKASIDEDGLEDITVYSNQEETYSDFARRVVDMALEEDKEVQIYGENNEMFKEFFWNDYWKESDSPDSYEDIQEQPIRFNRPVAMKPEALDYREK